MWKLVCWMQKTMSITNESGEKKRWNKVNIMPNEYVCICVACKFGSQLLLFAQIIVIEQHFMVGNDVLFDLYYRYRFFGWNHIDSPERVRTPTESITILGPHSSADWFQNGLEALHHLLVHFSQHENASVGKFRHFNACRDFIIACYYHVVVFIALPIMFDRSISY